MQKHCVLSIKVVVFVVDHSFKEKRRAAEEAEQLRIEDEVAKAPAGLQKKSSV